MPLLPITSPETIEACKSLPLRPSDIFICSYPKSGTTWTQHIVLSLILADRRCRLNKERCSDSKDKDVDDDVISYEHVSDFAPFYEIDAHWDLSNSNNCLAETVQKNHHRLNQRVFNTHLRWDMLPKEQEQTHEDKRERQSNQLRLRPECGKFIYVTRNLLDVCASFYHHLSNQKEGTYTESYDTFARDWMAGKVAFGSPVHHLLSFAEGFGDNFYRNCLQDSTGNTKDQPLLLLSYQDMKVNLRQQVLRIINFLDLRNISMDMLDNEILPTFEFQSMKENIHKFQPKSVTWLNNFQFLRKGVVGDGKNLMTIEDEKTNGEKKIVKDETALLVEYNKWVDREEYRTKVQDSLNGNDSYLRDVFLGVADAS